MTSSAEPVSADASEAEPPTGMSTETETGDAPLPRSDATAAAAAAGAAMEPDEQQTGHSNALPPQVNSGCDSPSTETEMIISCQVLSSASCFGNLGRRRRKWHGKSTKPAGRTKHKVYRLRGKYTMTSNWPRNCNAVTRWKRVCISIWIRTTASDVAESGGYSKSEVLSTYTRSLSSVHFCQVCKRELIKSLI